MKTISIEKFNKIFNLCRNYDPFTQYIEHYRQQNSIQEQNSQIIAEINELMTEYGITINIVPVDRSTTSESARNDLINWFKENDIEVTEKRIWSEDEIRNLIQTNDKVLYGALKKLYTQQTKDEKEIQDTRHANGVGFNAFDSQFLSSVAEFVIQKGFLTEKQKTATRKKLVKYTKQLTKLANI